MTFKLFMKRYWRIPVVAILAALVAFGASFVVKPTYTSNTRLLIVEGSTTLLNSSGQPLSSQPSVTAPSLAQTLAETDAGLASSRQVATMVVNQLHLDKTQPTSHGPIHMLEAALASTYAHVRGWITAGFYKQLPRREKAIQTTEAAIVGTDLAPTGGPDTGQADSYVLELSANGSSAIQSQQIANTAANALITVSEQRFIHDSQDYAQALGAQLNDTNTALAQANQAVSNYEVANNISSIDQQMVQNVQDQGAIQSQAVAAQASVQGDKQTVASLQATLASTNSTETSNQNITTGRSTTADDTTQANPVYQTIQGQLSSAQAALASDTAKASSLQGQLQANPSAALTVAQAKLLDLEEQVTADQNSAQSLSSSLQQAEANVQVSPVELSRLGTADLPVYPSSPKRYLYLMIGLLVGGLAGSGLTYQARRRQVPVGHEEENESSLATAEHIDMSDARRPERQPVSAGVGASHLGGNGKRAGYSAVDGNGAANGNGSGSGSPSGNGNGSRSSGARGYHNGDATDHASSGAGEDPNGPFGSSTGSGDDPRDETDESGRL